jgi:hypothetical protein
MKLQDSGLSTKDVACGPSCGITVDFKRSSEGAMTRTCAIGKKKLGAQA